MDRVLKYSEETCNILDEILSGLICSSNSTDDGIIKMREELVERLMCVIELDECSDFYYIVKSYLDRLVRMQSASQELRIELTKSSIQSYLQVNIRTLVKDSNVNVELLARDFGVNVNLSVEEDLKVARNFLYTYCIKKLEDLKTLNISLMDALIKLDALYDSVMTDWSTFCIHTESIIIEDGVRIGKEYYSGSEGHFRFYSYALSNFQKREAKWLNSKENVVVIENVESYNKMNDKAKDSVYEIAKFNIPPFDEHGCIMAGDILTVIGDEGTGKTNYMVNITTPVVISGFSIIVMCGESKKIKILNMYLSRFIYLETGYKIHWSELLGDLEGMSEDLKAIIRDCRYNLFENPKYGKIVLVQKFSYSFYYDEIVRILRQHRDKKFGMVAIDHTDKLDRGEYNASIGALKDGRVSVNTLYNWILDLKMEFNLAHLLLAHTGSEAASLIAKGKDVGKRIGATSSATSKDADIVMHLESGPAFERKKLVKAVIKKFREVSIDLFKPVVLKKDFSCCNYIYSEALQAEIGEGDDSSVTIETMDAADLI